MNKLKQTTTLPSWYPNIAWEKALRTGNQLECVGLLQTFAWELLHKYLNGGLGKIWYLFPAKLGTSNILKQKSTTLSQMWMGFSTRFNLPNPMRNNLNSTDVTLILCKHYQNITSFLNAYPNIGLTKISNTKHAPSYSYPLRQITKTLGKQYPLLFSYWFHGSVGSHEIKPDWSDFDGLAIISNEAFQSPAHLTKLRRGLITTRKYMIDFMPFQLHGHFILTQADLHSYPSCMFPATLFKNAECTTGINTFDLYERFDQRLSLEMLWIHGIKDLLSIPTNRLNSTVQKIAFLHRVFLLPCLVFQAQNQPCFKKEAFAKLNLIFSPQEIDIFQQINEIWLHWHRPHILSKITCRLAMATRFNPLLYHKTAQTIGKKIPWFHKDSAIDWPNLVENMRDVATSVWYRTLASSKKND